MTSSTPSGLRLHAITLVCEQNTFLKILQSLYGLPW